MTQEERIAQYTKRRANGTLAFPRTAKAHLKEILRVNPDTIKAEDMKILKRL